MLDDLTNYLQTHGIGTLGQSLFEYYQPDQLDNMYMLNTTGGPVGDDAKYLPVKTTTIQVITRNTSVPNGKTNADTISAFLHNIRATQMGSTYFYYILKLQEPIPIGKDSSGRYEWSQNFIALSR